MPILLDRSQDKITVKILNSPFWEKDKETVKSIFNRKFNPDTKLWEVPYGQIGDFFLKWRTQDILWHSEGIKELHSAWQSCHVKLDDLEPITRSFEFKREPIDYQERYIRTNQQKRRLLCAFEQGTGKTYSSLERVRITGFQRVLVVCPKVVCTNWRTEARFVLGREAVIYQGTKPQRAKQMQAVIQLGESALVICTYETLKEINSAIEDGGIAPFDQIIIDEAHLACNPESERFKAVDRLTNTLCRGSFVQALTGTPMQHRIRDIWGIIYLLDPVFAGSREAFLLKYELVTKVIRKRFPVMNKGKQVFDEDGKPKYFEKVIPVAWRPINTNFLQEYLACIMYRVTREDITSFRDTVETVTIELHPRQRKLYDRLKKELLVEMGEERFNLRLVPVRLLRLLQAAEGLFNFPSEDNESSKLEYICHELDNTEEKILIWSRFRPITELLGQLYAGRGVVYNGGISDRQKILAKWAFNGVDCEEDRLEYERLRKNIDWPFEPGGAQFFFGTVDMRSSLGMNLHKSCRRQIFSSFSYMGNANAQAADRLRRIGQDADEVITQYLVAEDTFEEKALAGVLRNYNSTLHALGGSGGVSYRQISQIIDLLRDSK